MSDNSLQYLTQELGDYLLLQTGSKIISGDASRITTVTAAFQAAQASKVRKTSAQLYVVSHAYQYGEIPTYSKEFGGSGNLKVAQRFTAPKTMNISAVEVFVKGSATWDAKIMARIEGDSSNLPDGVNKGQHWGDAVTDYNYKWRRITFNTPIAVTAGTKYWIVFENYPTTDTDNYYVAADDSANNTDWLGCARYGSGSWQADTTKTLFTRLVSDVEADNEKEIAEVQDIKVIRNKEVPAYSLSANIVNKNYMYSIGQVYSSYFEGGKKIKAYIGFSVGGVSYATCYLAFVGLTNDSPATSSMATLNAQCYMTKVLTDKLTSQNLGGMAYETLIQTVAQHAGITDFSLRTTGKTSRSGILFQDMDANSIIEKARQATLDVLQFKNTTTLTTEARAKATVSPSSTILYALDDDTFLIDVTVEPTMDKLVNRLVVTNDENGETTTDGNTLTVGNYITIGTGSGVLGSSTASTAITISFGSYACIYNQWDNSGTASTAVSETGRDCGGAAAYGSMTFTVQNKNYGSTSGTYNITIKGCPISNAGSNTKLFEGFNQSSWESFGNYTQRVDNRIFAGTADEKSFSDAVLDEYAQPVSKIKANCRGIVDIYPNAIVSFKDNRTKLENIAVVDLVELNYRQNDASFTMYIEATKTKYQAASGYILLENGTEYLLQQDGSSKIKMS